MSLLMVPVMLAGLVILEAWLQWRDARAARTFVNSARAEDTAGRTAPRSTHSREHR